jgi:hypothetical protein
MTVVENRPPAQLDFLAPPAEQTPAVQTPQTEPSLDQLPITPNIMTVGADAEDIQELLKNPDIRLLTNFGHLNSFAHRVGDYSRYVLDAVVLFGPKEGEDLDPVDMMYVLRGAIRHIEPYPRRLYVAQRYTGQITARHLGLQNYNKLINLRGQLPAPAERVGEVVRVVRDLVAPSPSD